MLATAAYGVQMHCLHAIHNKYVSVSTREGMWMDSIIGRAFALRSPVAILADAWTTCGAGTEEVLYEAAALAIAQELSALNTDSLGSTNGVYPNCSGLENRLFAEVVDAVFHMGMTEEEGNAMIRKIYQKYEHTLDEPKLGQPFNEVYDVKTIEPTPAWQACYDKVKADPARHGHPVPLLSGDPFGCGGSPGRKRSGLSPRSCVFMDAAACKPGPAVIACRMLEDELLLAMRRTGKEYPVAWLESGLHETPQLLHAALMEAIAAYDGRYGVLLLAMGACGNAVDGIGAAHSTLVLPRFQDCIGLLLDEPRASDAFYLTRGWLRGERALPCAYRRARERYGEKTARAVYEIMLRNYAAFSLLDTGAYPLSGVPRGAGAARRVL